MVSVRAGKLPSPFGCKLDIDKVQTLVDGSILVVGGSNVGGLVLNEANINVPTYEIVKQGGGNGGPPVTLPILQFTAAQNLVPGKSYNLYPMRKPHTILIKNTIADPS